MLINHPPIITSKNNNTILHYASTKPYRPQLKQYLSFGKTSFQNEGKSGQVSLNYFDNCTLIIFELLL
jgi:hypothetical protein